MNCQSFESNITDLARQVPLEATALEDARAHAEDCRPCAALLDEQRKLSAALHEYSSNVKSVPVPDRIEEDLLKEFRRQQVAPPVVVGNRGRWLAIAAAVALIAITAGVLAMRLISTPNSITASSNTATPLAPIVNPKPVESEPANPTVDPPRGKETLQTPRYVAVKKRPRVAASRAVTVKAPVIPNASPAEVTTDFMTLSDLSTASLQEGAQVFRVELPRYAMARFGLPVNMERYDERVKADVWVGVDGLARAIRFVQ